MRHAEDFRCRNREGLGGYFRSGCSGKASLWRLHLSRENNEWKAKTQGKEQGCVFQQLKTAGEHRVGGRGQVQAGICGFSRQGLGSLDFKCEGKPLGGLKLWGPLLRPLPPCL